MARYSHRELAYCDAIAQALVADRRFRCWFVGGGILGTALSNATLDPDEQRARRSTLPAGDRWWFNYWGGSGAGIETDILVVFSCRDGARVAIHVEVKTDKDGLRDGQAEGYRRRVALWADPANAPRAVPPHDRGYSILVAGSDVVADPRARLFHHAHNHREIAEHISGYPV